MTNESEWTKGKSAFRLVEIAANTGFSVSLLRTKIRDGKLLARKMGSSVFVLPEDLRNFLNQCERWTPGEAPSAANDARRTK